MPEELGGGGLDHVALTLMERELGRTSFALQYAVARPSNILRACQGEQIERYAALLDVHLAVQDEPLFALHRSEPNLECPVGFGIRPALASVYGDVDRALRRELARTTIADVLDATLRVSR